MVAATIFIVSSFVFVVSSPPVSPFATATAVPCDPPVENDAEVVMDAYSDSDDDHGDTLAAAANRVTKGPR